MREDLNTIEEIRNSDSPTVGDYLRIENDRFHCAKCEHELGNVSEGIKRNLALRELDVEDLGNNWIDPALILDEEIVFREFLCPECATRIFTESCRRDDPIVEEVRINPDTL